MATNKRKDATALFELIDKSTLKVPKRTGSLKIPSWWSSKTNPPGAASGGSGGAGAAGGEGTVAAPSAGAGSAASARTAATENKTEPAVQRRLYEPPQAGAGGAGGGASPSIRPPVPVAPLSPGQAAALDSRRALHEPGAAATEPPAAPESGAAAAQTNTAHAKAPQAPDEGAGLKSAREGYAGSGTGRRVFAPQTMSQDTTPRGDWALAQKFRLARAPMWALIAGGAVLLVLLCGLIYLSRPHAGGPRTVDADTTPAPEDDGGRRLLPRPVETAPATRSQQVTPQPGHDPVREPPEPVKPVVAQWYGPGAVTRSATLYYVVIATSPSEEVSQRNAKLLAAHGVSVSYETMTSRGATHPLYRLMSADGFKTLSEAEPFRKKVVAIGHYVWDYAKTHKGWESAYVLRGASLPGNVAKGQ